MSTNKEQFDAGRQTWTDGSRVYGNRKLPEVVERSETSEPGADTSPTASAVDHRGHTPVKHDRCDRLSCQFCEGGLYGCLVCGGLEGAMPTRCPGEPMTPEQTNSVYEGRIDYRQNAGADPTQAGGGRWMDGCSIDSPAQWSGPWEIRLNGVPQCTIAMAAGEHPVELNIFRGACWISTAWPNEVIGVYNPRTDHEFFVQNGHRAEGEQ